MKRKTVLWLWLFAGVLSVLTGLRDIFAPGFFNMSPLVESKVDIILQFVVAAMMFVCAGLMSRPQPGWPRR